MNNGATSDSPSQSGPLARVVDASNATTSDPSSQSGPLARVVDESNAATSDSSSRSETLATPPATAVTATTAMIFKVVDLSVIFNDSKKPPPLSIPY